MEFVEGHLGQRCISQTGIGNALGCIVEFTRNVNAICSYLYIQVHTHINTQGCALQIGI